MKEILLGELIRQRREELGLTQTQLCEGICEVATISRLENGKYTPSHGRIKALLQRLGLPEERYYAIISKQEEELEHLQTVALSRCYLAESASEEGRVEAVQRAWEALAQLEQVAEVDDLQTQQFIMQFKAVLPRLEGKINPEEVRAKLIEALRLTVPRFDPEDINCCLYSLDEIKIIYQIAVTYLEDKQEDITISIYRQMLYYIKKRYQNMPEAYRLFPMITHNYALALMHCKKYEEALKIAEQGRKSCNQYGYYQMLPGLTHIMMECTHLVGDDKRSTELCYEAYYLYKAFENERGTELLATDAKMYLDITLAI